MFDPFGYARMWWSAAELAQEATQVVALRMWGLAEGIGTGENSRMLTEKGPAFTRAAVAAQGALFRGESPDRVADAAMRSLATAARANRRRLTRS